MAVAYKGSSTANSGSTTSSTITLNVPVGTNTNDITYVYLCFTGGSGVTVTPPTGFSLRYTHDNGTTYGMRIYEKIYAPGDPTSFIFTLSGAQYVSGVLGVYTGVSVFGAGFYLPDVSGSVVDSTGGTTATASIVSQADGGFGVKMTASFNTTAALTTTSPGSGLTTRADTSTTATSFIEVSIADGLNADAMLNNTIPASTLSGSATNNSILVFYLRPQQTQTNTPQFDYANRGSANSTTTGSFSVIPSVTSEIGVVAIAIKNPAVSVSSITATGLVWSLLATSQNAGSNTRIELWTAMLGSNGISTTVSYTLSGSTDINLAWGSFPAAGRITNVVTASGNTGSPTSSLTTKTDNSLVLAFLSYSANVGTTAAGSNTLALNVSFSSATAAAALLRQFVTTKGTSVTSSASAPTSTPWAMVQIEVPAYDPGGKFLTVF